MGRIMGLFNLRYTRRQIEKMMDISAVQEAIKEAEQQTSGEIRVSISRFFWGSVRRAAERAFVRLDMMETADRNGILFFILPSRKSFAVIGDAGIHARVGQEFWDGLALILRAKFREKQFTKGLLEAVTAAGAQLSSHFPYVGVSDVNELPDEVDLC
jgi:uncharacterized membrane protein